MSIVRAFGDKVPRLGAGAFLAETAVVVGDVVLGDATSVWYGAVLRGDVGSIRIGARSNIQDNATIHMTYQRSNAEIGAECIIAHNSVVHGARLGDRVLVGMGAVVMDNAQIGDGAWIAAGSVVPAGARIGPGQLVRGTPARVVRAVSEEEQRWAGEAITRYVLLAAQHRNAGEPSDAVATELQPGRE